MMKKVEPPFEEITSDTGAAPEPGHDAWFRRQVQKALDDENLGKAEYTELRAAAAEFGIELPPMK